MLKLINKFIQENSEEEYKKFHSKLTYTKYEINGIRVPVLRKFAKELIKKYNLKDILAIKDNRFEVVLLQGFCIGYLKIDIEEKYKILDEYILKIDDWSICDMLASTIKNKEEKFYLKCLDWLNKDKEFVVRFGIVCLKINFLEDDKIEDIILRLSNIQKSDYYIEMAIAWCLQEISINYYDKVDEILNEDIFSSSIIKKTRQKIRESIRKVK